MHVFYPTPDVHFIEGDETLYETFIEEPIYNPFSLNENGRTSPVIKYQGDVKKVFDAFINNFKFE